MKAAVYYGNKDIRIENVVEPDLVTGDAKIRVDYCGICATDLEEYLFGPQVISKDPNPLTGQSIPMITGHEVTGTVVGIDSTNTSVTLGDRVAIDGIITCGNCWWCENGQEMQCGSLACIGFQRNGGLAEYLTWPADHLITLPDNVTSEQAALIEPTAVAVHALHKCTVQSGTTIAIVGVGTVGMVTMQAAKAMGARVLALDVRDNALEMANSLGADVVINTGSDSFNKTIQDATDGLGPDYVLDTAAGPDTAKLSIDLVRKGGIVVLVGIYTKTTTLDFNSVVLREVNVVGSVGYERQDMREAIGMVSDGNVQTKQLISDIISIDNLLDVGYKRMMSPKKDIFRILVDPSI